jgi:hypothetical protein
VTLYLFKAGFYGTLFSLARRGAVKMIPVKEISGFADSETIDVPGTPRVVHTPGHTPGSAAVLLEDRRVLLTGDVLATKNALTGRARPQIMSSGLNEDTDQAFASLGTLAGISAALLLPGHGEPWTGTEARATYPAPGIGLHPGKGGRDGGGRCQQAADDRGQDRGQPAQACASVPGCSPVAEKVCSHDGVPCLLGSGLFCPALFM